MRLFFGSVVVCLSLFGAGSTATAQTYVFDNTAGIAVAFPPGVTVQSVFVKNTATGLVSQVAPSSVYSTRPGEGVYWINAYMPGADVVLFYSNNPVGLAEIGPAGPPTYAVVPAGVMAGPMMGANRLYRDEWLNVYGPGWDVFRYTIHFSYW